MKTKEKINERKVLMIAPVFVLLVCAGIFYALGGGSGAYAAQLTASGINQSLPDAAFKKAEPGDKLGIYEMTARDSAKVKSIGLSAGGVAGSGFGSAAHATSTDPTNELTAKLEALNKELSKPSPPLAFGTANTSAGLGVPGNVRAQPASIKNDVDRLESLMKTMQDKREEDPEVTQLSGMLDKIISIQNPELVSQKLRLNAGIQRALPDSQFRAVPAILVDKQKVTQGASVKIRLSDTLRIGSMLIPKGHELFALTQLSNHRLLLNIKNIRLGTSIIPVNLSVYSLDGMPGIDAPEAELEVAAGAGFNDAVQGIQFLGMDQSIGVQAAGAGIDAAKSLLTKKIRKIRVPLKAGFKVLLRNNQPVQQR
ncbi:hypothetical protein HDF26_002307 [Pedobacter cryoconitis]|uniref:conjugative transposon protein TraM n=1 Tax=Pedobacter cryoconitis TaxID=188932 RepID=UPI001613271E|nr:conjugative transposon protein TraM [Pedobacter cryoconitis]MBB6271850.1 hypothetical protein [Pedobacter cryoconitis]